MFQHLLDALDFWMDRPRKLKGWLYAIAFAAAIIGAAFILDRCAPEPGAQRPTASSPT